jgi:hypothetical protein
LCGISGKLDATATAFQIINILWYYVSEQYLSTIRASKNCAMNSKRIQRALRTDHSLAEDELTIAAVEARLFGHAGFPEAADALAYDAVQRTLAVSPLAHPFLAQLSRLYSLWQALFVGPELAVTVRPECQCLYRLVQRMGG